MSTTSLISFVILTYQRKKSVLELLHHLSTLQDKAIEIIVVDNNSSDGTVEAIRKAFPEIKLLALAINSGVGARNHGLEISQGEIIITLDDDILGIYDKDLAYIRSLFHKRPDLGALTFRITWPGTDRVRDWVHRRPVSDCLQTFPSYEITEGAVAFRRKALDSVGLYREDFFISHEGLDLSYRLMNASYAVEYDGKISVQHKSAVGGRPSWRRYYYDTRNLFWIAILHHPFWYGLRYLLNGVFSMAVYSFRDGFALWWLKGVFHGLSKQFSLLDERHPLSKETLALCKSQDRLRPSFWKMARRRLSQKNFSLD